MKILPEIINLIITDQMPHQYIEMSMALVSLANGNFPDLYTVSPLVIQEMAKDDTKGSTSWQDVYGRYGDTSRNCWVEWTTPTNIPVAVSGVLMTGQQKDEWAESVQDSFARAEELAPHIQTPEVSEYGRQTLQKTHSAVWWSTIAYHPEGFGLDPLMCITPLDKDGIFLPNYDGSIGFKAIEPFSPMPLPELIQQDTIPAAATAYIMANIGQRFLARPMRDGTCQVQLNHKRSNNKKENK